MAWCKLDISGLGLEPWHDDVCGARCRLEQGRMEFLEKVGTYLLCFYVCDAVESSFPRKFIN